MALELAHKVAVDYGDEARDTNPKPSKRQSRKRYAVTVSVKITAEQKAMLDKYRETVEYPSFAQLVREEVIEKAIKGRL